jgi:hypothetical protein
VLLHFHLGSCWLLPTYVESQVGEHEGMRTGKHEGTSKRMNKLGYSFTGLQTLKWKGATVNWWLMWMMDGCTGDGLWARLHG